jgi:hypothetical protein
MVIEALEISGRTAVGVGQRLTQLLDELAS